MEEVKSLVGVVAGSYEEFKRLLPKKEEENPNTEFRHFSDATRMRGFRGEIQLWGTWGTRKDLGEINLELMKRRYE